MAVKAKPAACVIDAEQLGIARAVDVMASRTFHLVQPGAEQRQWGGYSGYKPTRKWDDLAIRGWERERDRVIITQVTVKTSALTNVRIRPEVFDGMASGTRVDRSISESAE